MADEKQPLSTDAKRSIFLAICLMLGAVGGTFIQSCLNGQPPTRTQVEAAEDRFCAGVAKIRAAEKAFKTSGSNEAGGSE
jgi:hypothetical protein